jgi:hypothetical protein
MLLQRGRPGNRRIEAVRAIGPFAKSASHPDGTQRSAGRRPEKVERLVASPAQKRQPAQSLLRQWFKATASVILIVI